MNKHSSILAAWIALVLCGCVAPESKTEICPHGHEGIACELPFEIVYARRSEIEGRLVSLDGILVIGDEPEPPGNDEAKILLFSSGERARLCNLTTAVEVVFSSEKKIDLESMQKGVGYAVNIVGRLSSSAEHWLAIESDNEVSIYYLVDGGVGTCLVSPPPVLPE